MAAVEVKTAFLYGSFQFVPSDASQRRRRNKWELPAGIPCKQARVVAMMQAASLVSLAGGFIADWLLKERKWSLVRVRRFCQNLASLGIGLPPHDSS